MKIHTRVLAVGWAVATVSSALFVLGTAGTAAAAPVPSCADTTGFDASNEGWRDQSFMQGGVAGAFESYGPAEWNAGDGFPASGSIEVPDQDNGWQEAATPALSGADHSAMVGATLTFAYKYATDGQNVSNNVYVALRGNGEAVYFPFQGQVAASGTWATITVPMTADAWLDSFTYDGGPTGSAPSADAFAAVLASLDELAISVEGSDVDNDVTLIDTLALDCPAPEEPDEADPAVPESPSVPAGGTAYSTSTSGSDAFAMLASGLALLLGIGGALTWREHRSGPGRHSA